MPLGFFILEMWQFRGWGLTWMCFCVGIQCRQRFWYGAKLHGHGCLDGRIRYIFSCLIGWIFSDVLHYTMYNVKWWIDVNKLTSMLKSLLISWIFSLHRQIQDLTKAVGGCCMHKKTASHGKSRVRINFLVWKLCIGGGLNDDHFLDLHCVYWFRVVTGRTRF